MTFAVVVAQAAAAAGGSPAPETPIGVVGAAVALVGLVVAGLMRLMSNSTQRGDNAYAQHIALLVQDRDAAREEARAVREASQRTEERAEGAERRAERAERRAEQAEQEAAQCRQVTERQARELADLRAYTRTLNTWLANQGIQTPPIPGPETQ